MLLIISTLNSPSYLKNSLRCGWWIIVLVVTWLLLPGCKDWSTIAPGATELSVTITDTGFQPQTWRVPAGTQVTLHLKNEGQTIHDWTLMARPVNTTFTQQDNVNILFQVSVEPGETRTVHLTTPKAPMAYQVLSTMPGDIESGLIATLVVVAAGPGG